MSPSPEKMASEICSIRIMFPVNSDEEALAVKKKITEAVSNIPDVHTNFSISTLPPKPLTSAPNGGLVR